MRSLNLGTKHAHCSSWSDYSDLYERSIKDPVGFWSELAQQLYLEKPWDEGRFLEYNFDIRKGPVFVRWMSGALSNVCYNVLDRHVKNGYGDKVAFYWEGNDPNDSQQRTYQELLDDVCRFANVLKSKNVKKGDRVAIYLPVILQLPVVMLACARLDANAEVLVTADGAWRGSKLINLKKIADHALVICRKQYV
ncbi:unnamed protein product [Soboliphyme baturini]|uniref:acetate--CoA ligase n=1 Tax=Soboliphyme baturini TaxID=241478 RepID=A0A183IQE6_9BILA|nr:unnamed protein product [Soboliphyme baturini]